MFNTQINRRDALKLGALTLAALAFPLTSESQAAEAGVTKFTLPDLPYPTDALQPIIGEKTMMLHHGKHHKAYVDKLNKALEAHPEYYQWPVEKLLSQLDTLPEAIRKDVRNQGGGHANHSMFWKMMAPPEKAKASKPSEALVSAINAEFGSMDTFKTKFQDAGVGVFGSGWVWLAVNSKTKNLAIRTTPNQDSLLLAPHDEDALLGNDVWEHAYYLNYQNKRADYLKAWWDVADWNYVSERFKTLS